MPPPSYFRLLSEASYEIQPCVISRDVVPVNRAASPTTCACPDAFASDRLEQAAKQQDVFLTIYGVLTNKYLTENFRDDPGFERIRTSIGLER